MAIWWKISLLFLISLVYCQFLPMELELRSVFSNFEKQHIVNSIQSNISQWNELLQRRIGCLYGEKNKNSFVVSTSPEVIADFDKTKSYKFNKDPDSNLYWSLKPKRIFFMIKITIFNVSSYDVYDCKKRYYVAGLDDESLPVHFEGHESRLKPWTLANNFDIRRTCDKLST